MLVVNDLGTLEYRQAWAVQEEIHAQVVGGAAERLLLVEHPPVITVGRRPEGVEHLLASREQLAALGVEVVESDRGGDITFHGPGQLVAYPIFRLNDHGLNVGRYVRMLQETVISTLGQFGIAAHREEGVVGVWTEDGAKICAIGVRIRRGVSMHGLALNVTTDLRYFDLVVPCGLAGRAVTSLKKILGERALGMELVKAKLVEAMRKAFARDATWDAVGDQCVDRQFSPHPNPPPEYRRRG